MRKYLKIILFLVLSISAFSQQTDPAISDVSGTASHDNTLNITGNNLLLLSKQNSSSIKELAQQILSMDQEET